MNAIFDIITCAVYFTHFCDRIEDWNYLYMIRKTERWEQESELYSELC